MPYILAAIVGLALLIAAGNAFTRVNPGQVANVMRKTAALALLGAAGFLALRGMLPLAIPLFLAGLGLLGIKPFAWQQRTPGQKSRVSTSLLAMELDHDSGNMAGEVLSGRFAGRHLSQLSLAELLELRQEALAFSDQSSALLDAFLDRQRPALARGLGQSGRDRQRMGRGAVPAAGVAAATAAAPWGARRHSMCWASPREPPARRSGLPIGG